MDKYIKKIKRKLIPIIIVFALILVALFAKQCYFVYIMGPGYETEVAFENVPKWLIYGGQERYDDLYRMGRNRITQSLEKKYSTAVQIDVKQIHVMVDGYEVTEPIEYRTESFFDQRWFEYNGVVMAECAIDGKDCIAYVDIESEEWRVYDTYQRDEIIAAITEYFEGIADTEPLYSVVNIQGNDTYWYKIGPNYTDYYDMNGAVYNYFDGDVEKFLTNNKVLNNVLVSMIYSSKKPLNINEEFIKQLDQEQVCLVRIANEEKAKEYAESDTLSLEDVWPYVDEAYISRGRQEKLSMEWLWEYQEYKWTPKYNNVNNQ